MANIKRCLNFFSWPPAKKTSAILFFACGAKPLRRTKNVFRCPAPVALNRNSKPNVAPAQQVINALVDAWDNGLFRRLLQKTACRA